MTARSKHNGRPIVYVDNRWVYEDSIKPVLQSLAWIPNGDEYGWMIASSRVFHDEGGGLAYVLQHDNDCDGTWVATFEGAEIAAGSLEFCVEECAKSENATLEPEAEASQSVV